MLIGFLLSIAAGYFLQPYVKKIRLPKFYSDPAFADSLRVQVEQELKWYIHESKSIERSQARLRLVTPAK